MTNLRGCPCCGKVQRVPTLAEQCEARCVRCQSVVARADHGTAPAQRTAAAALGALILYLPAILLPIIEVERLGHRRISSLASGVYDLFQHGDVAIGVVVLMFSIVLPLAKILLLLELSLLGMLRRAHRAASHRWMERIGRWSMMDVLMLALLVMVVKLGDLVTVRLGPAVWAFAGCVALSLIASACFDPHALWNDEEESR